jgi:hypothetical protein
MEPMYDANEILWTYNHHLQKYVYNDETHSLVKSVLPARKVYWRIKKQINSIVLKHGQPLSKTSQKYLLYIYNLLNEIRQLFVSPLSNFKNGANDICGIDGRNCLSSSIYVYSLLFDTPLPINVCIIADHIYLAFGPKSEFIIEHFDDIMQDIRMNMPKEKYNTIFNGIPNKPPYKKIRLPCAYHRSTVKQLILLLGGMTNNTLYDNTALIDKIMIVYYNYIISTFIPKEHRIKISNLTYKSNNTCGIIIKGVWYDAYTWFTTTFLELLPESQKFKIHPDEVSDHFIVKYAHVPGVINLPPIKRLYRYDEIKENSQSSSTSTPNKPYRKMKDQEGESEEQKLIQRKNQIDHSGIYWVKIKNRFYKMYLRHYGGSIIITTKDAYHWDKSHSRYTAENSSSNIYVYDEIPLVKSEITEDEGEQNAIITTRYESLRLYKIQRINNNQIRVFLSRPFAYELYDLNDIKVYKLPPGTIY